MQPNHGTNTDDGNQKISIEAENVEGVMDLVSQLGNGVGQIPEELEPAVEGLMDVYRGLEEATERYHKGKQRKKVREYSGREDINSGNFGHMLRTLEAFEIAVQDGNRWRLAEEYQ